MTHVDSTAQQINYLSRIAYDEESEQSFARQKIATNKYIKLDGTPPPASDRDASTGLSKSVSASEQPHSNVKLTERTSDATPYEETMRTMNELRYQLKKAGESMPAIRVETEVTPRSEQDSLPVIKYEILQTDPGVRSSKKQSNDAYVEKNAPKLHQILGNSVPNLALEGPYMNEVRERLK